MLTDHRSKFAKRGKREMCSFGSSKTHFEFLSQFRKSSKCVWVFRNTGANAVAKNQTRLAYEDKRDLYCMCIFVPTAHPIRACNISNMTKTNHIGKLDGRACWHLCELQKQLYLNLWFLLWSQDDRYVCDNTMRNLTIVCCKNSWPALDKTI